MFDTRDEAHMRRALTIARRGQGRVEPNPMVGCVIVDQEGLISEGYHRKFGRTHAEINALNAAKRPVKGATAYVTLEPCSHHGKTPPCVDALIEVRLARVVVAMSDPYPKVSGRGIRKLRAGGVNVDLGCLKNDAQSLNAPYLTLINENRPFTILKWAQSLDGRISTPPGVDNAISGPDARQWVHRLRARVDAIAVGVGTVRADDPLLTARDVPVKRLATRVIFDSQLTTPTNCRLLKTLDLAPTLILTTTSAFRRHKNRAARLTRAGADILPCKSAGTRVCLNDALLKLGQRQCTNILIEGGAQIINTALRHQLADRVHVFVAPRAVGGSPDNLGLEALADHYQPPASTLIGPDALFTYNLHKQ